MEEKKALRFKTAAGLLHEGCVIARSNVLKHPDRDNPVEAAAEGPVILQPDLYRQPGTKLACLLNLFL